MNNTTDKVLSNTSAIYDAAKELKNTASCIGIDDPEFALLLLESVDDLVRANNRILNHLKERVI